MIKKLYVLSVFIFASGFVSIPVYADSGLDAYNRGDYVTALRMWRSKAESGDSNAQYNIGWLYVKGRGVQTNNAEAVRWFLKAAKQGEPSAQSNLGVMYAHGRGVQKDYVRAYMWSKLAAEQGDSDAQDSVSKLLRVMTPSQVSQAERLVKDWRPR